MSRPPKGGHIRLFPNHSTPYRLISVTINGVRKQKFEHRLVMEKILNRPLKKEEIVHHKDGNGLNNSPSNLMIMTQSQHTNEHKGERWKWSRTNAIELRNKGYTIEKIATIFKVSPSAIRSGLIREGVKTVNLRWGKQKWDTDKAIQLYKENNSIKFIASQLKISAPTVRKFLIKQKIHYPKIKQSF